MDSVYEAVPLDHGASTNIRVIEVLDGADTDVISIRFHTISMGDGAPYKVLSYTWGDPGITKPIELNGRPFEVRQNLWDFLHEARRRGDARPQRIWIDALCINQTDVKEKNHQVAMMGEIYAAAEKVVVWLGTPDPVVPVLHWEDGHGETTYTSSTTPETLVKTLRDICQRRYWGRLWILQEFVLAKDIDIWCGTQTASLEAFTKLLHSYIGIDSDEVEERVESLLVCREVQQLPLASMSFRMLLNDYDFMGCSDVRDRIYAILSLLDEDERRQLENQPDYSLNKEELFHEVSRICNGKEDLDFLRDALGVSPKVSPHWDYGRRNYIDRPAGVSLR